MAEVVSPDGTRLHVETDGSGEPVTVFAHGLTNSCTELAPFTPFVPGTAVRFCFRGHGHSEVAPEGAYRFADLAADLDAVTRAYGATRAAGTSLGAGAITHLVAEEPDRFERLVLLLPAALDLPPTPGMYPTFARTAELLDAYPKDEAIDRILEESGRKAEYVRAPWLREFDLAMWSEMNPTGVARAIRGAINDRALEDREALRRVAAPTLIIAREHDAIHPAELARILADIMPNAELVMFDSEAELMNAIPQLVQQVAAFLA
jgi:pimeloyl-ACP methyl ester carboxylesterase